MCVVWCGCSFCGGLCLLCVVVHCRDLRCCVSVGFRRALLIVVCCLLLVVVCCWLLVVGCGCLLFGVCCCSLVFVDDVCCSVWGLLRAVFVYGVLFLLRLLLFVVCCVLFW